MTTLPILELGDDPFERGLIHGREIVLQLAALMRALPAKKVSLGLKL